MLVSFVHFVNKNIHTQIVHYKTVHMYRQKKYSHASNGPVPKTRAQIRIFF